MTEADRDYLDDEDDADAAREDFEREVATRGLKVALAACIEIASDKKATPQARASAANTIVRSAGMFDRKEGGRKRKELHEMTRDELTRERIRLTRLADAHAKSIDSDSDSGDGVFQ